MNKSYPVDRVRKQTLDIPLAWGMLEDLVSLLRGIAVRAGTPFLLD